MHALQEIRRLLTLGGVLIDIHPVPQAWLAEVHQAGRVLFAEPWRDHDYYDDDVRQAENALARVIERRLFVVEGRGEFDFLIYGSSPAELRDFLVQESAHRDGPQDEAEEAAKVELFARVEQILRAAGGGAEVARRETVRISRLRPVRGR